MLTIKQSALLLSLPLLITACGGSSGSSDTNTNDSFTITAIDGYLANTPLYLQNDLGECLNNEAPFAITNGQGKVEINDVSLLAKGYCLTTNDESIDLDNPQNAIREHFTLYSPTPRLLEQSNTLVISPFTTYLHTAITAFKANTPNADENALVAHIDSKKIALANALNMANDEITLALIFGDFIEIKNDIDNEHHALGAKLHLLAQVLTRVLSVNSLSSEQIINIARASNDYLDNQAGNSDNVDALATFVSNHLHDFANEQSLPLIDADLISQMPQGLSLEREILINAVNNAIENAQGDNQSALTLAAFELANINDLNNGETLQVYMAKHDSIWPETQLDSHFDNGILSINSLTFNQQGDFVFSVFVEKTLDNAQRYVSLPRRFVIRIDEAVVANTAPQFSGFDSAEAQALLSALQAEANNANNFTQAECFGSFCFPAEFSLSTTFMHDEINHLFNSSLAGISHSEILAHSNGLSAKLDDFGIYIFAIDPIEIPSEGSVSHSATIYGVDNFGVKSEAGFGFTLHVHADSTASINTGMDSGEDNNAEDDVSNSVLAVMLTPERKQQIIDTLRYKLGVDFEFAQNLNSEQVFELRHYSCSDEGICEKGATADNLATVSLSVNPYISINEAGEFIATGTPISHDETLTLSATYQGEAVKIYEVDSNYTLLNKDLTAYGTQYDIVLSTGPHVELHVTNAN